MAHSVKPADAGVSIGQVFQGKYRVNAILGQGGMGVVAECTHLALNERVAVKMLRQDVLMDQDAVSRFIREAQAAVKLKSEYVARVSDVGTFENGVPYMVMEFLEGHDLGELLQQRGVLPVQWAVELVLQTAEALAEAHSLGIVHRDVKPTNLFVTWRPDGSSLIKVLDFGISKSPMGTDMHLTQTQSLLGTPAYMSPEQMRSARLVDTRTDIWSLGTVFYEILEGRRPFEAESFSEMCVKVAVDPPAPMVNTPAGLQQVIMRCLAKAPEQRYANMAELGRDLVPYAADPHGAQMLVERMSRMLRRSTYDWESGGTGVGRQAGVPGTTPELGSGPVRAQTPAPQQWGLGSDPAAQPWNPGQAWHGSTPRGDGSQPFARPVDDPSQPFARPRADEGSVDTGSTVFTRKKSRVPLILVLLGLLAAGGVVLGMALSPDDDLPAAGEAVADDNAAPIKLEEHAAPVVAEPVPANPPTTNTATDRGSAAPHETAEGAAAAPSETEAAQASATDANEDGKSDPKTEKTGPRGAKKAGTAKTGSKPSVKPRGGKAQKASANGGLDPNADHKPPEKPAPKCNPFDSMHGCTSK